MNKEEFCKRLAGQLAKSREYVARFQDGEDGTVERRRYAALINDLYRAELAARQYGGLRPDTTIGLLV